MQVLPTDKRYPALDGLRALALSLVLILHSTYGQFAGGFVGVDVFFVLSGFLITSSLRAEYQRSGRVSLRSFWLRRARRLLPAFGVMIGLAGLMWRHYVPSAPPFGRAAGTALLYVANIQAVVDASKLGPLAHTWSLSTEEQFYLFWPLVATAVLKFGRPWPMLFTALIAAIARAVLFHFGSPAANYFSPLCRVDQLLIGCSLAVTIDRLPTSASSPPLRLASLVFLASLFVLGLRTDNTWAPYYYGVMSAVAIGAACLIAALRDDAWWLSRIFASPPFRWIGQRSYGLYLFHFPIFVFLEQFRVPHSPMNFALVTAARVGFTLLVAAFSWSFLERPLMKAQRAHGQQTI